MKKQTATEQAWPVEDDRSLKKLVSGLVVLLTPAATANKVFILNEVPSGIELPVGPLKVIAVIQELLATVCANAKETCISVTAERYRDTILLRLQDQNNYNGYALSFSLIAVERHARFAGGDLSVAGMQQRVATVSFSFPAEGVHDKCICIH